MNRIVPPYDPATTSVFAAREPLTAWHKVVAEHAGSANSALVYEVRDDPREQGILSHTQRPQPLTESDFKDGVIDWSKVHQPATHLKWQPGASKLEEYNADKL
jgi:hypothetical protein